MGFRCVGARARTGGLTTPKTGRFFSRLWGRPRAPWLTTLNPKSTAAATERDTLQIFCNTCCYCQKPFSRAGSRRHHERYTSWKRLENGQDKLPLVDFPPSSATSRGDSSKITLPTEEQNKFPNGIEFGEAFRFKTPSSIWSWALLVVARLVPPNRYF